MRRAGIFPGCQKG
uniref:Uncharacterized protein n=1 Tax=Anguilla anguilla TaxID=7936 RepID=A0A0E9QMV7_ANGAN